MIPRVQFGSFAFRVTACHMVSYSLVGMVAFVAMDYRGLFQSEGLSQFMRPLDSAWVPAGPGLQVVRGLVLAAVLYPFRQVFLEAPAGVWKLFALLVGLSVLSTSGPSPGSLEGLIYTRLTWQQHLRGLPEVLVQNLLFCWALIMWMRSPGRGWNVLMGVLTALVILMSLAGVLLPRPE